MKVVCMTAIMIFLMGIAAAQGAAGGRLGSQALPKPEPMVRPCLLGTERCLGMGKIPVSTCLVTSQASKAAAACAVDGMKLIGKFTL
jgi:hypothetical protein